jgi:zinc transport system substrate-binding protein
MKKLFLIISLIFSIQPLNSTAANIKDGAVVATIKPIHSLVEGVLGDLGNSYLMVSGSQTLHGYILKPSDISAINNANLVFYTDECIETFIKNAKKNINKDATVIRLSDADGVKKLIKRKGVNWEIHEHHHDEHHEEHGHEEHHEEYNCKFDGHMWLKPDNAIAFTKKIAGELAKAYPLHQQKFFENAQAQIAAIQASDKKTRESLTKLTAKNFIVFHDAYQYFEDHYGLHASGSITIDPSISPSAKRVKEIKDKISKLDVKCIFKEPVFNEKLVNLISEGREVKSITLDPEGASFNAGKDLYLEIMDNLSDGMQSCFN